MNNTLTTKICSKCKISKNTTEFRKKSKASCGYSSSCKVCDNKRDSIYREYNRKSIQEKQVLKRLSNPELVKIYNKEYHASNRDKILSRMKNYRKENPSMFAAKDAKKRMIVKEATPKWADLKKIQEIYKKRNILNTESIKYHVDHIIPLRGYLVCGLHVEYNLQIIPAKENLTKKNRFSIE